MKRSDIYWADLFPRSGSEQKGRRPVVILSHDAFNQTPTWQSIIIVPLSTSEKQLRRGPTAIFISKTLTNLKEDSVALCHQITTLDRSKLTEKIGVLPLSALQEIEKGIRAAIDLS